MELQARWLTDLIHADDPVEQEFVFKVLERLGLDP